MLHSNSVSAYDPILSFILFKGGFFHEDDFYFEATKSFPGRRISLPVAMLLILYILS